MAKKPITSTLFRFIKTRNPQLLSNKQKDRGFIYYPKDKRSDSYFLRDLDIQVDRDARNTYLETKATTFTYLNTRADVEAIKPDLYEFSHWLMKNKNVITLEEVLERTTSPAVSVLTTPELIKLWDNLYYQVITKKSDAVREAVIKMIVADNFLTKDDSSTTGIDNLINNDEEIQRLAHAFVVIPDNVLNNYPIQTEEEQLPRQKDFQALNKQLDAFVARFMLDKYKTAKEEIKTAININQTANRESYKTAFDLHTLAVKTAYVNATKVIDPSTSVITYDNLVLPEFNYTPTSIYDANYLDDKVSTTTLSIFNSFLSKGIKNENNLLKAINTESNRLNKIINKSKKSKSKTVVYNGNIIKVNPKKTLPLSYSVNAQRTISDENKAILSMSLATGYKDSIVTDADFSITFSENTVINNVNGSYLNSKENGETIILSSYPNEIPIPSTADSFTISGNLTLDNGEIIDIDTEDITIDSKITNGRGVFNKTSQDLDIKNHGITRIGVADFKRVDQEVCCYVPGEVSRIENILAREYKERSTRQLLSSESTIETTSETETETLSDTTTSERNELSSEVSSIINEDSSNDYGASAGVSGDYGKIKFYADGYFNGASSSSSSNSNNTSQTHAEEITTRALERVVQKVSKKRTSRILREFEENNKHGFDNRGGDNHVTGVYRWVDKIYTNKLINYGKRLMYEFNVPEPARFFKEAIIIPGEEADQTSSVPEGLISPLEPADFPSEIENASFIEETNYQEKAALYNAEVQEPPKNSLYVGKSFSFTTEEINGGEFDEVAAGSENFKLPEGYKTIKAIANWHHSQEDGLGTHVLVGYVKANQNEEIPLPEFIGEIPISYSSVGHHSGSVNVEIECERTDELFQKWQNETYNAILNAYQERVNEYNDFKYATFQPTLSGNPDSKLEFNPLLNRAIEKRELKRLATHMMAKPFNINTARNSYGGSFKYPILNSGLDTHASYVKFFEQAFDWEIMAYIFYPYFYGDNEDWTDLIQQSNGTDHIFQAFLQSGMARMVVPVRPGFENAVTYFLETGDVWMGDQLALDREDDLYLSIAEEMQATEGKVEKEWETRVPTALTIVQSNSAPLDENGLPCCHDELETEHLAYGTSIMVAKPDPVDPPA